MNDIFFSRPGHLISRAGRLSARVAEIWLRPLGLSVGQLPVLGALMDGNAKTQKDLAAMAHIEQPTMAQTLSRMERDGLIQRQTDPSDKRSSLILLTPAAQEKMLQVQEMMFHGQEEVMEGFSESEKELLVNLLRRVIANLEAILDYDGG